MYRHFAYIHPDAEIRIIEDGELPKCNHCLMRCRNLDNHQKTNTCKAGMRQRLNEQQLEQQAKAEKVKFFVNDKEIERVTSFKYLGQILQQNDDDILCIQDNLSKLLPSKYSRVYENN